MGDTLPLEGMLLPEVKLHMVQYLHRLLLSSTRRITQDYCQTVIITRSVAVNPDVEYRTNYC